MSEWISVKDKLPEAGEFGSTAAVLIAVSNDEGWGTEKISTDIATGWYDFVYERWYYYNPVKGYGEAVDEFDAVTHWMPLPDIPKGITLDDCTDLCEWEQKGEKEADNPGVFLERPELVKMSNEISGISVEDIVKELPPEVGKAFGEIASTLREKPDRIERCREYSDALNILDEKLSGVGACPPWLRHGDWKSGKYNFVFLNGYSEEAIKELDDLSIDWERENGDCGSQHFFQEHCHITLDNGQWIDALDVCDNINIIDNKVYLKDWRMSNDH